MSRAVGEEAQTKRRDLIQVSAAPCLAPSDVAFSARPGPTAAVTENLEIAPRGPVCIVDDDVAVCDSLRVLLETHGFAVLAYASGVEFLKDNRRRAAKCLVIDQHMPGLDGLDVVGQLQRDGVVLPAILITGRLDAGIARRAGALDVRAILEKPFKVARLVELIGSALTAPD
jgi:two-component system response regulator FixJ